MNIINTYFFGNEDYKYNFYLWSDGTITKRFTLYNNEGEVIDSTEETLEGKSLEEVVLKCIKFEIA